MPLARAMTCGTPHSLQESHQISAIWGCHDPQTCTLLSTPVYHMTMGPCKAAHPRQWQTASFCPTAHVGMINSESQSSTKAAPRSTCIVAGGRAGRRGCLRDCRNHRCCGCRLRRHTRRRRRTGFRRCWPLRGCCSLLRLLVGSSVSSQVITHACRLCGRSSTSLLGCLGGAGSAVARRMRLWHCVGVWVCRQFTGLCTCALLRWLPY